MADIRNLFIKHLGESKGNVSEAVRRTGISRKTYYNWRKEDPDFAMQCDIIISSYKAPPAEPHEEKENKAFRPEELLRKNNAEELAPRRVRVEAHVRQLKEMLEDAGIWKPDMRAQATAAARIYAACEEMEAHLGCYDPIVETISREGNVRIEANPLYDRYGKMMERYQSALKALGLNLDSRRDNRAQDDSMSSFLANFEDEL